MARVTITGFTAERMLEIEQNAITQGRIVGNNLILTSFGGTDLTAGNVRGPKGDKGDAGGVWDATSALKGAVRLAGNIGGTADVPMITGALNNTVDLSDARVNLSYEEGGQTVEITNSPSEMLQILYSILNYVGQPILRYWEQEILFTTTVREDGYGPANMGIYIPRPVILQGIRYQFETATSTGVTNGNLMRDASVVPGAAMSMPASTLIQNVTGLNVSIPAGSRIKFNMLNASASANPGKGLTIALYGYYDNT